MQLSHLEGQALPKRRELSLALRATVIRAGDVARRLKHSSIDQRHLSLALLEQPSDPVREYLAGSGIRTDDWQRRLLQLRYLEDPWTVGQVTKLTEAAKATLAATVAAAGAADVEPLHLLLAIVEESGTSAAAVAREAGVDAVLLRQWVDRRAFARVR